MQFIRFIKPSNYSSQSLELMLFCLPLAFVFLVELTMSYYFPIVAENTLGSNFSVGLIVGAANICAILCDLLLPQLFSKRGWKFFFLGAVGMQIGFPFFTNLGFIFNSIYFFILAAIFWNIYFEFFSFARHNFIATVEKRDNFTRSWGITSVIVSITSIIGPILGSTLLSTGIGNASIVFTIFHILVIIFTLILVLKTPNTIPLHKVRINSKLKSELRVFKEFGYWKVIGLRILPILILGLTIAIVNASVTTVGGLMGEELLGGKHLDWLIIVIFDCPALVTGILLAKFRIVNHKKHYSQILLILGSIPLMLLILSNHNALIVLILFLICSICFSSAWVLNESVYSDLQQRAKENKVHISSMERIGESFGFLTGPILIGFLSDISNYFYAFSIVGTICFLVGIFLLATTPRKLRLPQGELVNLAK